jgi:ParB family chromosome partitioning protein
MSKTTTAEKSATNDRFGAERRTNLFWYDPAKLLLVEDPKHPLFDERLTVLDVDERLTQSIMDMGIMQPVMVRKDGEQWQVVDGRQRVRCAREANRRLALAGKSGDDLIQVPSVPVRGTPEDLMVMMIAANELRRMDDPITKASKMSRMLKRGSSMETLCSAFGCSPQTAKTYMELLDCGAAVQRAVREDGLPINIAKRLAKLNEDEQAAALADMKEKGHLVGKKGNDAAKAAQGERGKVRKAAVRLVPYADVETARTTLLKDKGGDEIAQARREGAVAAFAFAQGDKDALRELLGVKAAE